MALAINIDKKMSNSAMFADNPLQPTNDKVPTIPKLKIIKITLIP